MQVRDDVPSGQQRDREWNAEGWFAVARRGSGLMQDAALPVTQRVTFTGAGLCATEADADLVQHYLGRGGDATQVWGQQVLLWDADEERWDAAHHPFTAPEGDATGDPGAIKARAYDLVLDGQEIGGGSIRIHRRDVQERVFELLGIASEEASERFGFLLDALRYGAPPHGGIAFGLDRLVALIVGVEQIRDVIAFPKTQRGQDLMVETPSPVTERQLRELHLRLRNQ